MINIYSHTRHVQRHFQYLQWRKIVFRMIYIVYCVTNWPFILCSWTAFESVDTVWLWMQGVATSKESVSFKIKQHSRVSARSKNRPGIYRRGRVLRNGLFNLPRLWVSFTYLGAKYIRYHIITYIKLFMIKLNYILIILCELSNL